MPVQQSKDTNKKSSHIFRRDTCRLCGGRDLELVLQLTPTPFGGDYVSSDRLDEVQECYPVDLFLCLHCGYIGLLDIVAPRILMNVEVTSKSLGVVENLRELAEFTVARITPTKDALAVDVGSNDGTLLKFFQQSGLRVLGVEPAAFVADMALDSGIPTIQACFSTELALSIKDEWGPAQIVSANRVLANLDQIKEIIEGIRLLLATEGVLVFETGYLVDIIEDGLFDTICHQHLGYDTAIALDALFRSHDLELIEIERIPIKGGSLRGMVQIAGGPRRVAPSVAELINFERNLGADRPEFFKNIPVKIKQIKDSLSNLLLDLKVKGKTVAGYGAGLGTTTMIYDLSVGDNLDFLADDAPQFRDLFSPGYHIPVVSPQSLYDRKPDYVIIMAWRHAEPIIKKHQMYLDQGGHFIVPMPDLKIV